MLYTVKGFSPSHRGDYACRCLAVIGILVVLLVVAIAQFVAMRPRTVRRTWSMKTRRVSQEQEPQHALSSKNSSQYLPEAGEESIGEYTVDCLELSPEEANALNNLSRCWEPSGPQLDFTWNSTLQQTKRKVPLNPKVTCQGIQAYTRTCLFLDLLWDLQSQKWVFYGPPPSSLESPEDPWIRLDRTFLNRYNKVTEDLQEEGEQHMHVEWRPESQRPPVDTMMTSPLEAVHLRVMLNPASLGHFLRDNLLPLVSVPLNFGEDPREYVWLQADSNMVFAEAFRAATPLLDQYSSWMPHTTGPAPHMLWRSLLHQAQHAEQQWADHFGHPVRYIRFPKLLAGRGGADLAGVAGELTDTPTYQEVIAWSHVCQPHRWQAMRQIAYENAEIVHECARQLPPLILFIDGTATQLRNFYNPASFFSELLEKLPEAEIRYERMSELSGTEQIQLLSRTTVLVSSIGSRSFRLAYLPDGAQVVLVGAPEQWGTDESALHDFEMPFREVEWCWGSLGYVNVLLYHVNAAKDLKGGSMALGSYIQTRTHYQPILRMQKLLPLLKTALDNSRTFGGHLRS